MPLNKMLILQNFNEPKKHFQLDFVHTSRCADPNHLCQVYLCFLRSQTLFMSLRIMVWFVQEI